MKEKISKRKIICISCPLGCELHLDILQKKTEEKGQEDREIKDKLLSVSGYDCELGKDFAYREIENPTRIMTSVVAIKNSQSKLLPVISAEPLPLVKIKAAVDEARNIIVEAPVREGDIVSENLAGSGIKLLAARSLTSKG